MQKELVRLANHLDKIGQRDLADRLDSILKTAAPSAPGSKAWWGGWLVAFRGQLRGFFNQEGIEDKLKAKGLEKVEVNNSGSWGRDVQKGWEVFTTYIGRKDLTQHWKENGPKAGYPGKLPGKEDQGDIQGMTEYVADYNSGKGSLTDDAQGRLAAGAGAAHWYDTYMENIKKNTPDSLAAATEIRENPRFWSEIVGYANRMDKALEGAPHHISEEIGGAAQEAFEDDRHSGDTFQQRSRQPDGDLFSLDDEDFEIESSVQFDRLEKAADLLSGIFSNGEIPLVRR